MGRLEKKLERMSRNPRDWSIEDLRSLANRFGIDHRQPGTSHVTFSYPGVQPLTVPAHKPIKPIYVKRFIELVEGVMKTQAKGRDEIESKSGN